MTKLIMFLLGWCLGIIIIRTIIFNSMVMMIDSREASAILCISLICVFTVVWGVLVGVKK